MDPLLVVLRLVHIISGAAWVGGAMMFFFFIEPTAGELGPDAEKFMNRVVVRRRLPIYFITLSALTVLAGLILYWIDSDGLQGSWIGSPFGLAMTVGGAAAVLAFIGGTVMIKPAVDRLAAIGAEVTAGGGPPTQAQQEELHAVQRRLRTIGAIDLVLLLVAAAAMAGARYL